MALLRNKNKFRIFNSAHSGMAVEAIRLLQAPYWGVMELGTLAKGGNRVLTFAVWCTALRGRLAMAEELIA
jgi:hypothetical protein